MNSFEYTSFLVTSAYDRSPCTANDTTAVTAHA